MASLFLVPVLVSISFISLSFMSLSSMSLSSCPCPSDPVLLNFVLLLLSSWPHSFPQNPFLPFKLRLHCPKTSERNFNLGVLNLYEINFMALPSVKYPYPVSNVLLHRI